MNDKDLDEGMKGMIKEVVSLQRGMMFAMLRAFWPYILGALLVSGASLFFIIWLLVKVLS